MICKIADLIVDIPASSGMVPRCSGYRCDEMTSADVIIRTELYNPERYPGNTSREKMEYMESGFQFYLELLKHNGLYMHASAIEYEGKAYLFSGNSGVGKSTHTRLWLDLFGEKACVFNDDKPALRYLDGVWYAYGTPWCGKDGINQNKKVPLGGICFLVQARENKIRRLDFQEALKRIMAQTIVRFKDVSMLNQMITLVDQLIRNVPVFELENRPEPEAARLSYETMRRTVEELGL